ncbi:histone deacetylase complex protein [Laccaria bicolor S238N-H82]|uniref:Histone deacetylase complex protein n=1 Tax=Laccaria bicolor (strain S238N-H82 / ATCC MYA-4686) TaxID=486041 RepID=B0CZE8_LACBS|nr:histone deacetylase complex protein [Laccaria bicolor S238N-H82]EDR12136.1 histone deacetylase complex protein [Laccaria bicolor S238N-H82]|eukprot:XP_001876400.1 histone deacetylase complex protein [Laccaria bicolor S238N-H82]
MEETTGPAGQPIISREKTAPFLIRTFVKIGSFHRLTLFEDGTLPTTDEQQLFAWKDATLREVLTILRNTAPHIAEYRHPLARFSFRTVYADSTNKSRFLQKELGMVYSRDILGEPGSLNATAPRLLEDEDGAQRDRTEREREERTLDELRFVPGDYLLIAVILPKNVTVPTELLIKGSGAPGAGAANGWRSAPPAAAGRGDGGWGSTAAPVPPTGRGGGHWRGESNAPPAGARGRGGGRGGGDFGRDRDFDRSERRAPPPRRGADSPPPRGGWGHRGGRGGRGDRRSRSRSRSPPRRRGRYD